MTPATIDDVAAALRILRAAVPGRNPQIDEETGALWHVAVSTFSGEAVVGAASAWVQAEREFPTLTDFIGATRRAARRIAQADAAANVLAVIKCGECDGSGWVTLDPSGQTTVRPCGRCRPRTALRQMGGHYMPGHDCQECRDLRQAKSTVGGR